MKRCLVLDATAFSALAGPANHRQREVHAAVSAARRLNREILVPAVILAELYRGPRHNSLVDACLSRETGVLVRDTDRFLARLVGGVLAAAGADSRHLADAHVIATAIDLGGGVVLTGDPDDLGRLAANHPNILVIGI